MNAFSPREGFVSRALLIRVAVAWLVICLIALARDMGAIRAMAFADPDDMLRLVQVRDLLGGQGWFDLHQYRINPANGGVLMHWSRLVDLPIAAMILLLRPVLGTAGAEQATAIIIPLFTLFIALLLAARVAWKQFNLEIAALTAMSWMLAFPTMHQLDPLRIDHHGWQIVAVLAAVNGLVSSNARSGGWLTGAAMAFGMSISLELLPFTGLMAGIFGLRWLRDPAQRDWLVNMMQALAVTSIGLFLATRGFADLVNHCDIIAPAYLAGFVLAALLITAIARLPQFSPPALIALLGVSVGAVVLAYLALAPECTTGPFAQLDPLVRKFWYNNVFEGRPVWVMEWPAMVQLVVPPLVALGALFSLYRSAPETQRRFIIEFGLLLAGALAIGIAVTRFGSVACALATIPLGWMLRVWLDRINIFASPVKRIAGLALLLALMVPGVVALGIDMGIARLAHRSGATLSAASMGVRFSCGMPASMQALDALPPATIFAPLDIGPGIIGHTRHSVIATGHHRASSAMHDVIATFLASPDEAHQTVLRHKASYVVFCSDLAETGNYRRKAKAGLAAQLGAGQAPDWLEPVKLSGKPGTLRVWRVIK